MLVTKVLETGFICDALTLIILRSSRRPVQRQSEKKDVPSFFSSVNVKKACLNILFRYQYEIFFYWRCYQNWCYCWLAMNRLLSHYWRLIKILKHTQQKNILFFMLTGTFWRVIWKMSPLMFDSMKYETKREHTFSFVHNNDEIINQSDDTSRLQNSVIVHHLPKISFAIIPKWRSLIIFFSFIHSFHSTIALVWMTKLSSLFLV